jgi:hypothetical protein
MEKPTSGHSESVAALAAAAPPAAPGSRSDLDDPGSVRKWHGLTEERAIATPFRAPNDLPQKVLGSRMCHRSSFTSHAIGVHLSNHPEAEGQL